MSLELITATETSRKQLPVDRAEYGFSNPLPLSQKEKAFIRLWHQQVGAESPAKTKYDFHKQLHNRGQGSLHNFSVGNYNENRAKIALGNMQTNGDITGFVSCAQEPNIIYSTRNPQSPKNVDNLLHQYISSGENLSNDSLKVDVLICREETNGQFLYCPIQIKPRIKTRNSYLILTEEQINHLRNLFPDKFQAMQYDRRNYYYDKGYDYYRLPVRYNYIITSNLDYRTISDIQAQIKKAINNETRTFQSAIKLQDMKGLKLLETLIESNLLEIGHLKTASQRKTSAASN